MKPLDSLRDDLQGILTGKEYQVYYRENHNLLLDLFNRLKDWLYSILNSLFPHTPVVQTASVGLAYVIAALGILLLLLLLFMLLSRFVRQGRFNPRRLNLAKGLTLTLQHHLEQSRSLAAQGEYSLGLRHLFLGLLLYLDQNRWIEAKAWKTNWEYFSELEARSPQLADSFTSLAVKFEEAMYGGRSITRQDYRLYYDQVNSWIQEGERT